VIKKKDLYKSNFEIHNINTSHGTDVHPPTSNLTTFQKGAFYFGIKVFNLLALEIKHRRCRTVSKRFLLMLMFYIG